MGLSQRVVVHGAERRDCLDQAWSALVADEGHTPIPLPNATRNVGGLLDTLGIETLILTGGNDLVEAPGSVDVAPERDRFECEALGWARARTVPVLGVCRGMQMLAVAGGATLRPVTGHVSRVHGLRDAVGGLPAEVNSFHRMSIDRLGDTQEVLARSPEGLVEALRMTDMAAAGVMWHPERPPAPSSPGPLALLERLLSR